MRKQILVCCIVVLAAVGVLCIAIARAKPKPVQIIHTANGVDVSLLDVTYGSNQIVLLGTSFQRSLYKMLPANLKSWSRVSMTGFTTTQPNVPTFWLRATVTNPTSGGGNPFAAQGGYVPVRLMDEFGCEYDPGGYSMGSQYMPNFETISHYQINAPDPHGKIVGICVYESNAKTNRLGTFMIPGAALAPVMATGQSPSSPKQDGELSFQLMSFVTSLKSEPFAYMKMTNGVLFSQATFRITKDGGPALNWFPVSLKITNSHGKNISIRARGRGLKNGQQVFNFEGALDPADGPFKLRFEFMHQSDFSPDELTTFKDVVFPTGSESFAPQLEAEVQGHKLVLDNIYAAQAHNPGLDANGIVIHARLLPPTNLIHLQLLRAVDEKGAEMQIGSTSFKGKGEYYYSFAPTVKASSATLTFAVHQSRFVEFEATPVLVATNALMKN